MKILRFFKTLWHIYKGGSPLYPKGMNTRVDAMSDLVEIGEGFISAPGSIILAHDASTITHSGKTRIEKTVIGKKVFLGANAVVLPGVTVSDGCIIGAGAVVTKSFPPYSVLVGNPARLVCSVDDYINKCEERNVLYQLPDYVLKKHGTGVRLTKEENESMLRNAYEQFERRNKEG